MLIGIAFKNEIHSQYLHYNKFGKVFVYGLFLDIHTYVYAF